MTADQVRARLRKQVTQAGSQSAWARANGVSAPYVHDVIAGRREPGEAILRPLGLERVVSYRRKSGGDTDGVRG